VLTKKTRRFIGRRRNNGDGTWVYYVWKLTPLVCANRCGLSNRLSRFYKRE